MREDRALILGGASCVWDDVLAMEEVYGKPWDGLVIAANDVGSHWPRDLHHWVSLHPSKFARWMELRGKHHQLACDGITTWSQVSRWSGRRNYQPLAQQEVTPWAGGSSGMLAVQVASELGVVGVVLCGIPMTRTPHFSETTERFHRVWVGADGHSRAWKDQRARMVGWVKSMSGFTEELLGAPSREWFDMLETLLPRPVGG